MMLFSNKAVPASYELKVPVNEEKNLALEFYEAYRIDSWGDGLRGYTYSFNGRDYRDVAFFGRDPVEDVSRNVQITTDIYGEKVLKTYRQIPTFDSGDREWDSEELEILFYDGNHIHLVVMRGGYKIANLTFYEKLLTADARIKPIFEKLGWPVNNIAWI